MDDLTESLKGIMQGSKDKNIETITLLTDTKKNINAKTEIYDPFKIGFLDALTDHLKDKKLTKTSKFLRLLLQNYKELMVSKDRKGRLEIIEAFKLLEQKERDLSFSERLFNRQGDI